MSFNEGIAELPRLTFEEHQILIRQALELDDPPLSAADEELVESRLAEHHADSGSSVPLDEMKSRLRVQNRERADQKLNLPKARPHSFQVELMTRSLPLPVL